MKALKTPQQIFKRTVILCIITVLILTAAAGVTSYLIASGREKSEQVSAAEPIAATPTYSSSATVLIQAASNSTTDNLLENNDVKDENSTDSITLLNTCAEIFMTDPSMKALMTEADVTVEPIKDTYLLRITATSADPQAAFTAANRVASTAPQVFGMYFGDAGKVLIVEEATLPSEPDEVKGAVSATAKQDTETLHIVLIAVLATLSASMLASIIITAAVHSSYKKKYARYQQSAVNYYPQR